MLDTLSTQIEVEWIWVEGQQDESNQKAYSLAKKAVASESTYWQEQNIISTRGALSEFAKDETASTKQNTALAFINNSSK